MSQERCKNRVQLLADRRVALDRVGCADSSGLMVDEVAHGRYCGGSPVVCLVPSHRFFAGLVPGAGRLAAQIVLTNQRFLNFLGPLRIDLLLAAHLRRLLSTLLG